MKSPDYYKGKKHGYEAHKVVEDFQGDNYNLGTALTYLMRAGKKPNNPITQDIKKAIHHLQFELNRQLPTDDLEVLYKQSNPQEDWFPSGWCLSYNDVRRPYARG